MIYVLIVLAYGNYGVSMHDFNSLQACVNAASIIEHAANKGANKVTTMCLPKR
jgi:hypothetical protein